MTLGGMIEADRRLRGYEINVRRENRRRVDEAVWKRWEEMLEEERNGDGSTRAVEDRTGKLKCEEREE